MRQFSVLVLVTLVMVGSVFAATDVATDPPDIRLITGNALMNAFDLNDYFSGNAGSSVNIAGSATIGVRTENYTVGGIAVSNMVKVSSFLVQNGAVLDGASSNPFVNVLRPGVAVNSAQALVGAPAGGGSPAGGSAPVWWITFASVTSTYDQGLRIRNTALSAQSDGPSLQAGGLTATIAANGTYTLTADQNFMGPVIVTFISQAGSNLDGASVLASKSLSVGTNYADNLDQARVVDGSAAVAQVPLSEVAVGAGEVTISVDVVPGATGMSVAIAAINGGFDFNNLVYENPQQAGTVAGQKMTISCTYDPPADAVIPLLMASGGQATFSNLKVFKAPSLADLSVGANEVDLHSGLGGATGAVVDGNFNAVADVAVLSPNQPNWAPGTVSLSTQNNFGASGKSVALGEATGSFDNVSLTAGVDPGAIASRIWVKGNGHYDFVMMVFNAAGGVDRAIGGAFEGNFSNWSPIAVSGSIKTAGYAWVVIQGFGGGQDALLADDMKTLQVQDLDAYFDAGLYAL